MVIQTKQNVWVDVEHNLQIPAGSSSQKNNGVPFSYSPFTTVHQAFYNAEIMHNMGKPCYMQFYSSFSFLFYFCVCEIIKEEWY